jgi:hypothetical protein
VGACVGMGLPCGYLDRYEFVGAWMGMSLPCGSLDGYEFAMLAPGCQVRVRNIYLNIDLMILFVNKYS